MNDNSMDKYSAQSRSFGFLSFPDSSICSSVAFQALENSDIVSVSTDFPVNSKREDP